MSFIKRFIANESGATAIEYGLFAALIAVAIVAAVGSVGDTLKDNFEKLDSELQSAGASRG
jgi:pilus assembly protein Flp/PilA